MKYIEKILTDLNAGGQPRNLVFEKLYSGWKVKIIDSEDGSTLLCPEGEKLFIFSETFEGALKELDAVIKYAYKQSQ